MDNKKRKRKLIGTWQKNEKKLQEVSLDKYMIIGSVVEIQGNFDKLMIIGYKVKDRDGKIMDYMACKYPNGATDSLTFFNHNDIKKNIFCWIYY